eukprot:TRINITY_DN18368_c0_g1_i1.p1 TRINITY_DN18368_c0_g1~~TRINITY_DN18368_c0_g1_i1.p1  ORF type:complete len:118 (+),score=2.26 TRINITY_DN18368_c0_g1_i1:951-1304(+)
MHQQILRAPPATCFLKQKELITYDARILQNRQRIMSHRIQYFTFHVYDLCPCHIHVTSLPYLGIIAFCGFCVSLAPFKILESCLTPSLGSFSNYIFPLLVIVGLCLVFRVYQIGPLC